MRLGKKIRERRRGLRCSHPRPLPSPTVKEKKRLLLARRRWRTTTVSEGAIGDDCLDNDEDPRVQCDHPLLPLLLLPRESSTTTTGDGMMQRSGTLSNNKCVCKATIDYAVAILVSRLGYLILPRIINARTGDASIVVNLFGGSSVKHQKVFRIERGSLPTS
ncbi:hypothetical protein Dimus_013146 [Dionaea muscipula]